MSKKFIVIFPLLFWSSPVSQLAYISKTFDTFERIDKVIRRQEKRIQRYWSNSKKIQASYIINHITDTTGIPQNILIAMIEAESSWFPRALGRNTNGTIDYGLTQQNSDYIRDRYQKIYHKKMRHPSEAFNIVVSLKLMELALLDCSQKFSSVQKIVMCYNSPYRAKNNIPTYWNRVMSFL
jgi:hypothetical protein